MNKRRGVGVSEGKTVTFRTTCRWPGAKAKKLLDSARACGNPAIGETSGKMMRMRINYITKGGRVKIVVPVILTGIFD